MWKNILENHAQKIWTKDNWHYIIDKWSSRGLYDLCLALLQPCTDHSLSVALWLERRLGLYHGPCLNVYTSSKRQGPDPSLLWLLVGTPSAFGPELAYRLRVAQTTLMDVPIYFWYTHVLLYYYTCICMCTTFLWPLRFGLLMVLSLYNENYLQFF